MSSRLPSWTVIAFRVVTALFLLAWLPALAGVPVARVIFESSWPVLAGLSILLAFRRTTP